MVKNSFLLFLLSFGLHSTAQVLPTEDVKIDARFATVHFQAVLGDSTRLVLDSSYSVGKNSFTFKKLHFYISNIRLYQYDSLVFASGDFPKLVKIGSGKDELVLTLIPTDLKFNNIRFQLGVDSLYSVSGIPNGDLHPLHGMYWTWQSGYINTKLEGKAMLNNSLQDFQFHLGGYLGNFNALQEINLPVNSQNIYVNLDLLQVINAMLSAQSLHIMSPSLEAVRLSEAIANSFYLLK